MTTTAKIITKRLTTSAQKGWYMAYLGSLPICARATARAARTAAQEHLRKNPTPEMKVNGLIVEGVNEPAAMRPNGCDNPDCPGWIINADRSGDIQRCDDCARFADDDAARVAAAEYLIGALDIKQLSTSVLDVARALAERAIGEEAPTEDDAAIIAGDQPVTCPKCGARTRFTDGANGAQSHVCLGCNHAFAVLA